MKNQRFIFLLLMMSLSFYISGPASVIKQREVLELLLEAGKIEQAKETVLLIENENEKIIEMSKIYFFTGNYFDAYSKISKVKGELAKSERTGNLKNFYAYLYQTTKDYQSFESGHFIVKTCGNDVILTYYLLEALENAYKNVSEQFGISPKEKVLVEVFPTKDIFANCSTLGKEIVDKTGTVGICKFNKLMIVSPNALPLGYSWLDTITHEYIHMTVNRMSDSKCPLWLHEGIARRFEGIWQDGKVWSLGTAGRNKIAEAVKKDKFITFEEMSPSLVYLPTQDDIMLAFSEVSSAVDYIIGKYGKDSISEILDKMKSLEDEKDAFKKVLGVSFKNFEKEYFKYLKKMNIEETPGAIMNEVIFDVADEDEFIGVNAKGHVRLGDRFRKIKKYNAAIISYEKALKEEPANPVILLKYAKALFEIDKYEEAKEKLYKAIDENPHYVTPYQELGKVLYNNGEYKEAIEIYTKAIHINPFHPETHKNLSRCYIIEKMAQDALRELTIAVILDPSDAESKVLLDRFRKE